MVAFSVIGTIAGVVLGLHFKVFVLAPTMLLASAIIIASGILSGHASSAILLTVFGTLALLQIGYLIGCALHAHMPISTTEPASQPVIVVGDQVVE